MYESPLKAERSRSKGDKFFRIGGQVRVRNQANKGGGKEIEEMSRIDQRESPESHHSEKEVKRIIKKEREDSSQPSKDKKRVVVSDDHLPSAGSKHQKGETTADDVYSSQPYSHTGSSDDADDDDDDEWQENLLMDKGGEESKNEKVDDLLDSETYMGVDNILNYGGGVRAADLIRCRQIPVRNRLCPKGCLVNQDSSDLMAQGVCQVIDDTDHGNMGNGGDHHLGKGEAHHEPICRPADPPQVLYCPAGPLPSLDGSKEYQDVVKLHRLGTDAASDVKIYEEEDSNFRVSVSVTSSRRFFTVESYTDERSQSSLDSASSRPSRLAFSNQTNEIRVFDANHLANLGDSEAHDRIGAVNLTLIEPRRAGVWYSVDHWNSFFLITTNTDNAPNGKIMIAPVDDPRSQRWRTLLPEGKLKTTDKVWAFKSGRLVIETWENAAQTLSLCTLQRLKNNSVDTFKWRMKEAIQLKDAPNDRGGFKSVKNGFREEQSLVLGVDVADCRAPKTLILSKININKRKEKSNQSDSGLKHLSYQMLPVQNYHGKLATLLIQSYTIQPTIVAVDLETMSHIGLSKQATMISSPIYETKVIACKGKKGVSIPLTVVFNRWLHPKLGVHPGPVLLEVFGARGLRTGPHFNSGRVSLMDRGVIYAYAHVRGGGELGHRWQEQGESLMKRNAIDDLIACSDWLIAQKIASPDRLALAATGEGAVIAGAAVNQRPELYTSLTLTNPLLRLVPFVLRYRYLWKHWGNPSKTKMLQYMRSYSPYNNIRSNTTYPPTFIKAARFHSTAHRSHFHPKHSPTVILPRQPAPLTERWDPSTRWTHPRKVHPVSLSTSSIIFGQQTGLSLDETRKLLGRTRSHTQFQTGGGGLPTDHTQVGVGSDGGDDSDLIKSSESVQREDDDDDTIEFQKEDKSESTGISSGTQQKTKLYSKKKNGLLARSSHNEYLSWEVCPLCGFIANTSIGITEEETLSRYVSWMHGIEGDPSCGMRLVNRHIGPYWDSLLWANKVRHVSPSPVFVYVVDQTTTTEDETLAHFRQLAFILIQLGLVSKPHDAIDNLPVVVRNATGPPGLKSQDPYFSHGDWSAETTSRECPEEGNNIKKTIHKPDMSEVMKMTTGSGEVDSPFYSRLRCLQIKDGSTGTNGEPSHHRSEGTHSTCLSVVGEGLAKPPTSLEFAQMATNLTQSSIMRLMMSEYYPKFDLSFGIRLHAGRSVIESHGSIADCGGDGLPDLFDPYREVMFDSG
eukprot:GHVN01016109.1.p1 GENE.GHVN01016109.1~~GHVN01016109.1.p1  ORF type:complete len:1242 (-),score=245.16 GHVN01016109.1:29-3754(-)